MIVIWAVIPSGCLGAAPIEPETVGRMPVDHVRRLQRRRPGGTEGNRTDGGRGIRTGPCSGHGQAVRGHGPGPPAL